MTEQTHLSADELAAYAAGEHQAEADRVRDHLASCPVCSTRLQQMQSFTNGLNDAWNRARLRSMGVAHPSPAELETLWTREDSQEGLAELQQHVEGCECCRSHLKRLEEGYAALQRVDPLGGPTWSDLLRQRYAAAIEMQVEAARGAFTTAAGMVRDVMTIQTRTHLAPAPIAGEGPSRDRSLDWHDAIFQTDQMSGEVSGSTDTNTGRGIITVTINKSGGYVAAPPIIDLINTKGEVVSTQFMLDLGDRYSTRFANLDQGRYLVGIREPGR